MVVGYILVTWCCYEEVWVWGVVLGVYDMLLLVDVVLVWNDDRIIGVVTWVGFGSAWVLFGLVGMCGNF